MNNENECSNNGSKLFQINKKSNHLNYKKNLKIMNDPAFHLNRTLKAYINNRLNKNFSTENIKVKCSGEIKNVNDSKINDYNISFNRIKTMSNIIKKNNFFSKNKLNQLKKNYSRSKKKLVKSISTNKINLSNYIIFSHKNKCNDNNNVNKDNIKKKKF